MRLQLEPLALRLAAPHLTGSDYTKLNALVASHEAARLAGNPAGVRQADTDFMLALYRASRSQLLLSFIESLWLRRSPFFWEARWALLSASTSRAPHRHSEIIQALQGGDIDAAQAFLTDEIQSACQFLLDVMSFKDDT
jgi:DNA-binding GntR family transcriptional regulator